MLLLRRPSEIRPFHLNYQYQDSPCQSLQRRGKEMTPSPCHQIELSVPHTTHLSKHSNGFRDLVLDNQENIQPFLGPVTVARARKIDHVSNLENQHNSPNQHTKIIRFSHGKHIHDECLICSVCLAPFEDGDELLSLDCRHIYHKQCIDMWISIGLQSNTSTCPDCRNPVENMGAFVNIGKYLSTSNSSSSTSAPISTSASTLSPSPSAPVEVESLCGSGYLLIHDFESESTNMII